MSAFHTVLKELLLTEPFILRLDHGRLWLTPRFGGVMRFTLINLSWGVFPKAPLGIAPFGLIKHRNLSGNHCPCFILAQVRRM